MYDMTPLKRLEVSGPGAVDAAAAAHHRQTSPRSPARSPTRCCSTTPAASAATSPWPGSSEDDLPARRQRQHRPRLLDEGGPAPDAERIRARWVQVRDITGGTCCIGLWGPLARDLVGKVSER